MAYKDFANDYKNNMTGNSLLFYGAEDYLMSWAVDRIIEDNVEEEYRDIDVRTLDGESVSAYDILSEARAYSMFSPKRIVIVKNYLPLYKNTSDTGMEELLSYAEEAARNDDTSSMLVFVIESMNSGSLTSYGRDLSKKCNSYEFTRLERSDLNAFINKRIRAAGKMLGSRELTHIIDVSGYYNRGSVYYLTHLDSDIAKLVGACEGDSIDKRLIDEVVMGETDKYVFDLVDSLAMGRTEKALVIAETIVREDDGAMAVLALLTKQFEIMYDSLELSDKGMSISQMAKLTGINEYRFKKAYKAAMGYSLGRVKNLLTDLYNTDRDIKNGDIDRNMALELFVVRASR
ncbi:MAG: DNA polymerase III subunit delta [Mogibacterium sp.]|nr:DNA polymerase III subunit delta [Mogibacterium sp.]